MRNCPVCAAIASKVVDSRDTDQSVRRRRECVKCGERWTTYEVSASAFLALTDLDRVMAVTAQELRASEERIAKFREEARQIRDDFGVTAYQPVRDGARVGNPNWKPAA